MNIGGQTFTVNQAAACVYSISPTENLSLPPAGVTGAQVTVNSNCAWTAASNAAWIVITGGNSGSGNGTVTYNVQPNTGTATRYGSMTIAGLYFNVSQDACSFFIQPTNEAFSYTSTQSSVQVSVQGGCNWSAVSNAPWITINSGGSGSGSGTVLYTIAANTSTTWPTSRTGTMTIAGQTFTATQAGQPTCPNSSGLSCDASGFQGCTGKCFQSSGGSSTVYVWLSRTDCDWYPRVNVPWIHITSVTDNGSNPRVVNYSVDANASAPTRLGVITINGLAFKVSEGGTSSSASGRVTTASGQGLAGVTITFSALTPYPGLPAAVVTDANGYWSQTGFVVCKGNWATATKSGYTFSPNKNGFNPGAVNVDFLAMPSQGSNGARFESTARIASVFSALSPRVAESTGATREASINDQKQAANDRSLPHDPTGFALLGCLAAVFVVRLYRLRQRP
jgi:hypothetical protein